MTAQTSNTVFLAEYSVPAYLIDKVSLTFRLHPTKTRVLSRIEFRPNPDAVDKVFFLHGDGLTLISSSINGTPCSPELSKAGLTVNVPNAPFVWEAEVETNPAANTALEGLYMSNGMYCTQCEAEGFRRITYYPDRPDVMAVFDVRIESDAPVLLSNGNAGKSGNGWVEWHDPWPKPAYLFALVAGDLLNYPGEFTTASGKQVELNIWVREGDEDKCAFGMEALIKSMKWDEDVYGREYDLDVFNIVAVDDFNAGAMENKGLNIFNSSAVLASAATATDASFERIEGIIAHEYFHNWTGNRITCRDWFQLSLKEGLTVFRDQQFTADMRSAAVKRIDDVADLRAGQFTEDTGPLSHNVRPESYVEINNFYTATVYEKGAEVIRMLKLLVGDAGYADALDLYFKRHDGDAATIEDWLAVFSETSGRDLVQFKRWYNQAGTPKLAVSDDFKDGIYTLNFKQETPPTPGQDKKLPQVLPISVGLLNPNGDEVLPTQVLEMTQAEQSFTFTDLANKPIPSILRGFSAPVILSGCSQDNLTFLLAHDTDPFNRWEAGLALGKSTLTAMLTQDAPPDPAYLDALAGIAVDSDLDPAFRARVLQIPGPDDMAQTLFDAGHVPDPSAIHVARETLELSLAQRLGADLPKLHSDMATPGPYRPDAGPAAKRALRSEVLALQSRLDDGDLAYAQFGTAENMTEQFSAFVALIPTGYGEKAVQVFYDQWQHERLVIDKWFSAQICYAKPENALSVAQTLAQHSDFNTENPNRLRSLVSGFGIGNPAAFHAADGAGYRYFADWMIRVDAKNPMVAARWANGFGTWQHYDKGRQQKIQSELTRIAESPDLSRDTAEMVARLRAG